MGDKTDQIWTECHALGPGGQVTFGFADEFRSVFGIPLRFASVSAIMVNIEGGDAWSSLPQMHDTTRPWVSAVLKEGWSLYVTAERIDISNASPCAGDYEITFIGTAAPVAESVAERPIGQSA